MVTSAHPRVCGENVVEKRGRNGYRGSSPRVRGKLNRSAFSPKTRGLIPACAGKTSRPSRSASRSSAHPRVCGENKAHGCSFGGWWGSSPRVRGKPGQGSGRSADQRLIPACAGKTRRRRRRGRRCAAHPRVCGENEWVNGRGQVRTGSSPRVRGKRRSAGSGGDQGGLIPACAGKTTRARPRGR